MKVETDVLGDMAEVEMATAGMVDMVVAAAVMATIVITPTPKPNLIHLDFILLLSGINFLLKSMTKFGRSMVRKVNKVEQSKSLVTSQLNTLLPSLVLCTKPNQQITPMRLNLLPIHMHAILLVAKQMCRKHTPSNDWQWAQPTLLHLIFLVCMWPTNLPIIILLLFLICFLLLLFIPILFFLIVNLIPMPILALLDATLFPFPIPEGFVMSPPTMQDMAHVKRTCLSSPVQQHTLANQVVKLLFSSSMKDCGLVPKFHALSSIKINFGSMASLFKTTPSIVMFPFPLNTLSLLFHFTSLAPSFSLTLIPPANMSWIFVHIFILLLRWNGIHKPCILHQPNLWRWK